MNDPEKQEERIAFARYTPGECIVPPTREGAANDGRYFLVVCIGVLAWLAGFMTAVMLFSDRGEARGTTPREQQIERYETLGK